MSEKNLENKNENSVEKDSRYWLSLEQWGNDPEFQKLAEQEFMSSPIRDGSKDGDENDGWARREFLKLMGASLAMATAGCIRRPVQKIVPYNKQPEEVTFAIPSLYTSTYFDGSEALGLLIKTRDGRPLKIEGNPKHPLNLGGTSVRAQAHILSLYDPERLQGPRRNLQNKTKTNRDTINVKWDDADDAIVKQLGKGSVVVLTGAVASPSTKALISDFGQAFGAKHIMWDVLANDEVREGQKASYGDDSVPMYRFEKAKIIVSIDADFLGTWINPTAYTRAFMAGRKDIKTMNKLVVFDSNMSLTGANADVRVKIKPSQQLDIVMGLIHEIQGGNDTSAFADAASRLGIDKALFSKLAADLKVNRGATLVVAGGLPTLTEKSAELQMAVNYLNSLLGNDGTTVDHKNAMSALRSSYRDLVELKESLNKGAVKTVIIHKTNPLYALPASFGFEDALRKAEMVIYTGDRIDETGKQADYVLPDNHSLENWGDLEVSKGLVAIHQPTIRPMYDTRSFQLSLMTWAYLAKRGPSRIQDFETYYDYLRNYWKTEVYPKYGKGSGFEDFWNSVLQNGFAGEIGSGTGSNRSAKANLGSIKPSQSTGYELVLYPTIAIGDGSYANISWLQELPDPVTKICWDNYVNVSIATAEKLKLKQGDILALTVNGQKLELPTNIQPGLHDDVMAVAIGYGRTGAGKVGNGIGINAAPFVSFKNGTAIYSGQKVDAVKTGRKYQLANPQGHHAMEGRKIVVEATLKEYLKDPAANNHKHKIWSIWSGHQYNGHKWGMSIDLNSCTGCNACVIACQSENNIPVVGKKYVIQGREMAWIRIDRYYVGDPKNAEVVFQPIMCQHCDNAPCETVCPVAATVHSSEGLNDMVYNRCVGTRYCANNCPYKVRRFNWFNYAKLIEKPTHLALNPDVTVRARGVMEKCSFCVHRIKAAKSQARIENRTLKDGDVKVACQTACPTDGIVFGDLNDPESQVAKAFHNDPRSYALLEEFHAAPSVRYMTKIRNNDQESRGGDSHKGGH